jgi:tRNA-splicing ligase RtcB
MIKLKGKYTNAKVFTDTAEYSCIDQIKSMINSPAFTEQVRIMPDTHAGKGSVVGFTMPVGDKLVPNTIGVDIGCGIYAYKTNITKEFSDSMDWEEVDKRIRKVVPLGFNYRESYSDTIEEFENKMGCQGKLGPLLQKIGITESKALSQCGSLGGGNHFIEFAESKNDGSIWLLIHTGSRNVGKRTCEYHQKKAIEFVKRKREAMLETLECVEEKERQTFKEKLKEMDVFNVSDEQCWLEGLDKEEYLSDMYVAQKFAHLNKHLIRDSICDAINCTITESIESVHNYIDMRDMVIRKGAIRAYEHEKVVIPFNMRDGSILAKGKGNADWNNSAPHGAGRIMSRSQAKQEVKFEDFKETMKGVWSSSVNSGTLDESPFAYKPREEIEEAIKDAVDVYDYLVPLYNLKDSNFGGDYSRLK